MASGGPWARNVPWLWCEQGLTSRTRVLSPVEGTIASAPCWALYLLFPHWPGQSVLRLACNWEVSEGSVCVGCSLIIPTLEGWGMRIPASLRPAWVTYQEPDSKTKQTKEKINFIEGLGRHAFLPSWSLAIHLLPHLLLIQRWQSGAGQVHARAPEASFSSLTPWGKAWILKLHKERHAYSYSLLFYYQKWQTLHVVLYLASFVCFVLEDFTNGTKKHQRPFFTTA